MKVSIIIPVYNVERYLVECLESAVNQTLKDIEIIAVNDGSTDSSPTILKKYEEKYSNFKVLNKINGGLSSARNAGLDIAKGEYIYFLDSDDYILYNDVIEYCYGIANDYYLDIITFDLVDMFDYDGNIYPASSYRSRKDSIETKPVNGEEFFYKTYKKHVFDDYVYTNLYRTEYLRQNNFRFYEDRIYEDGIFNLPTFIKAKRVLYVPYQFYFRRIRADSITTKVMTEVNVYSLIKNIRSVEKFYLDNIDVLQYETKVSLAEVIKEYLKRVNTYSSTINLENEKKENLYKEINELRESLPLEIWGMGYTKVSVIIPIYNAEKYLEQCLNSSLNQTLKDIEVIAVNDGSTDSSIAILKRYEKMYSNFKVINRSNEGASVARNLGLEIATGEYIYFLDSDDYIMHNDVMEYCYTIAKDHCLDIITFDSVDMYVDGTSEYRVTYTKSSRKEILQSEVKSGEELYNECKEKNVYKYTVWLNLYKRELLINNNLKFQCGRIEEDVPFNIFAFIKAKRVLYVPYEFYYRRLREGSVSSLRANEKNIYSKIKNGNDIYKFYLENKSVLQQKTKINLIEFVKECYISADNLCNDINTLLDGKSREDFKEEIQQMINSVVNVC